MMTAFIMTSLAATSACGPADTCTASDDGAPCLADLQFLGQGDKNPLVLRFRSGFGDADGDLGRGFLETFIDGNPTSLGGLSMADIYAENGLDYDATSGTLDVSLELTLGNDNLPESGTRFEVGMRAVDESDKQSEIKTVELEMTY